ncbi:hypothetical protein CWO89_17050 [Bradyrhizobium sp. Leo170]|nr:hypothetical protein CWO89_17050 [Bradyrhizobium sp. Leo170]
MSTSLENALGAPIPESGRISWSRSAKPCAITVMKNLRQGIAGGFGGLALRGSVSARPNGPAMLRRLKPLLP